MRFLTILLAALVAGHAGCERAAEPEVIAAEAALAATEGPVLFHCATANRSGGLWAAYLVRTHGVAWETALKLGRAAGLSQQSMIEAARRVAEGPPAAARSVIGPAPRAVPAESP